MFCWRWNPATPESATLPPLAPCANVFDHFLRFSPTTQAQGARPSREITRLIASQSSPSAEGCLPYPDASGGYSGRASGSRPQLGLAPLYGTSHHSLME